MISIIIPAYNEQDNLEVLHTRLSNVTFKIQKHDFEFIFINDGSSDMTSIILERLQAIDHRVKVIKFTRNFGSHAAIAAGLTYCNGDSAIMLAADMQDPPEIISDLIEHWEKGYRIVWGVKDRHRGSGLLEGMSSRLFYFMMNHLTDVKLPPNGSDIFLIDRTVIDTLKKSPEKNTSVYMLIAWLGFSEVFITYKKQSRYHGTSKWSFFKKIKLFLDSLISFSYVPLRFMSMMGLISALIGLLYSIVVVATAIQGLPVQGWATLMIVVLFLGGFQMTMLGLLGEYLWRAYDENRGRPRYVIEKNTLLDVSSESSEQKEINK